MQSFKTFYRDHYGFVWATVRRHGVTPMLVEDAVHDTFVVAYRRLEAFDGRRPKAWLYSIGRRVASSYRRTEGRRQARHLSAAQMPRLERDLETTVGAKTALDRFLDTLSPEDRELFVLSEVDGLTGPELATTLGRKLPTLYSRVRVLRQRFEQSVGGKVQESRPSASARGWMLLQPLLAAPAATGPSLLLAGAITLGLVGAAAVAVVQVQPDPPEPIAAKLAPSLPDPPPAPPVEPAATPSQEVQTDDVEPPAVVEPLPPSKPKPARPRVAAPEPEPLPDLAADTRLLREANAALGRGDAQRARQLLEEHEAAFARPAQPDVRAAVWVETLCALGKEADAKKRAEALLAARPGTPVASRLQASCAGTNSSDTKP